MSRIDYPIYAIIQGTYYIYGGLQMDFTFKDALELFNTIYQNRLTQIFIVAIVFLIAVFVLQKFVRSILTRSRFIQGKEQETMVSMLNSIIKYVATLGFLFFALEKFGIEVGSMLAGAGVIGIVIGFGAQSLVQDLLAGIFMIYEKQLKQGDWVKANSEHEGLVEEIGFRVIKIRQWSGKLVTINNGQVRSIENYNMNKMRVIENVTTSFYQNPKEVFAVLEEACVQLNQELGDYLKKDLSGEPVEPFAVFGMSSLNDQYHGYKYTVIGLCEDLAYFVAAKNTRRIIAQFMYENNIQMAEQHIGMRTQDKQ